MQMQYQQQQQQASSVQFPVTGVGGTGFGPNYANNYNNEGKVQLVIRLSRFYGLITRIHIFDEVNNIIAASPNNDPFVHIYWIYPGHYTVRLEISGQVMDNNVDIDSSTALRVGEDDGNLEVPKLYSSVPFSGPLAYATTTTSYLNAAKRISERPKDINEDTGPNGIFLFLRYPSEQLYHERYRSKTYWKRFDLLDESGNIVLQFPNLCTFSDRNGYLGICLDLAPGTYFLRYRKRNRSRMIPLTVYDGWYTQMFMMLASEPLFGSLRIFISRQSQFDADDEYNFYTDVCLDKLQNNDFSLNYFLLEQVAYGKFNAPMLGLVGTYMYLKSNADANDRLFDIIVGNLRERILNNADTSPDLLALNILRDFHHDIKPDYKGVSYTRTPMLRVAYDAIRRASATNRNLVAQGSLDDYIAEKQMFDSPYNTFKAINIRVLRRAYRMELEKSALENHPDYSIDLQISAPKWISHVKVTEELPADNAIVNRPTVTAENAFKKHGAQGATIFRVLAQQPDLRTSEISSMLKLPHTTVERIRQGLKI
ncbi:hypothetical protein [uncultured Flavobacterium sp.]|uniref:hypothetical protein n=1 Tax=uncultured Flavobacterium sp. TaxID=165435 RepID=UPI0025DAE939|nr:hypothetical protein [uncultured Flavobacterium sp.]